MKINTYTAIMIFMLAGIWILVSTGCAPKHGANISHPDIRPAKLSLDPNITYTVDAYDPLEGFNRRIYVFNYYFDKYVFLPAVSGYDFITPDYIEDRITNFFNNLRELKTLTNCLLQLKIKDSTVTVGRLLANSTVGLAGFYDPATAFGWRRRIEDFGQTLGYYHVGAGPYLVLPIFGPSTFRDAAGLLADSGVRYLASEALLGDEKEKFIIFLAFNTLNAIDSRYRMAFRYYQSGSPFEYELVRRLYMDLREIEIAK